MMKLYYAPGTSSLSPHIALREAGLPFELERVDILTKKTQHDRNYYDINPKGYTPALLLDDGTLLTEGAVIVQYIADQKPEMGLAPPAGTLERVKLMEWLHYIATEIHKPLASLYVVNTVELRNIIQSMVAKRIAFMSDALAKQPYLLGEAFTVADGYAFYALRFWQYMTQGPLQQWPALVKFETTIATRPSVIAALQAEESAR